MAANKIENRVKELKKNINKLTNDIDINNKSLKIIGASKAKSFQEISYAYNAGIKDFGENYLQEALPKINNLKNQKIHWHFIGSIQKKKCKEIAFNFDWVHTVDRIEIAERLNKFREEMSTKLNICIQINVDNEKTKSGIKINDLECFSDELLSLKNLEIRGLMTLPKKTVNTSMQKESFSKLRRALSTLQVNFPNAQELSMGMSNDYPLAIKQGSTMVRIGTNIFGKRK